MKPVAACVRAAPLPPHRESAPPSGAVVAGQLRDVRNAADPRTHPTERKRPLPDAFDAKRRAMQASAAPRHTDRSPQDLMRVLEARIQAHQPRDDIERKATTVLLSARDPREARRLFGHVEARLQAAGLQPDAWHFNAVIQKFVAGGDMPGAMGVLEDMLQRTPPVLPNITSFNLLLRGCKDDRTGLSNVLRLMREQSPPVAPDRFTAAELLDALARRADGKAAEELLMQMLAARDPSLAPDVRHWSMVVKAYACGGESLDCWRMVVLMQLHDAKPTLPVYGAALAGCARNGDWETARKLVADMEAQSPSVQLDRSAWCRYIGAHTTGGNLAEAEALVERMRLSGVTPDLWTYWGLMAACLDTGRGADALRILEDAMRTGVFAPGAGYNEDRNSIDLHAEALVGSDDAPRTRGTPKEVALVVLDWHLRQGHVDSRTEIIVGKGHGRLRDIVLHGLQERGKHFMVHPGNPGILVQRR